MLRGLWDFIVELWNELDTRLEDVHGSGNGTDTEKIEVAS
jgi:hypothetical protein